MGKPAESQSLAVLAVEGMLVEGASKKESSIAVLFNNLLCSAKPSAIISKQPQSSACQTENRKHTGIPRRAMQGFLTGGIYGSSFFKKRSLGGWNRLSPSKGLYFSLSKGRILRVSKKEVLREV